MVQRYRTLLFLIPVLAMLGCDSSTAPITEFVPRIDRDNCELDQEFLLSVLDFDAIPSIDDPVWVDPGSDFTEYLAPEDRVIGLTVNGHDYAIPHNILWHHEIVNMQTDVGPIAVTYCPLTGSSIAFSREDAGGLEFGVSGFLFKNNLVMYDRTTEHSLWVQMESDAACGPKAGTPLAHWPVVEMRWERWLELHPTTMVMGQNQGLRVQRDYSQAGYPYGDYEGYSYNEFLYPAVMPELDRRRPTKERVIGVPGDGAEVPKAFPFEALTELEGSFQVVPFDHRGAAVVLWEDDARGGMAFRPMTSAGAQVDLSATEEGIVDRNTGTTFTIDGIARSGPLQGQTLRPVDNVYVAFWGAWEVFHEGTELWEQGEVL